MKTYIDYNNDDNINHNDYFETGMSEQDFDDLIVMTMAEYHHQWVAA